MSIRLRIMTLIKSHSLIFLLFLMPCLIGCDKKSEPICSANSEIKGFVQIGSLGHSNGVKITIESVSNKSIKYVAVSDAEGKFHFSNLEADTYIISAEKEGYKMDYILLEKSILGSNKPKKITLAENEIREITICMSTTQISEFGQLDFTDMNGNPLNRITIPRNATTISMRLFNGTQSRKPWQLKYEYCFGTIRFLTVNVFSSFSISEGVLEAGDNVVLVGYINPEIFSSEFEYLSRQISLSDGSISIRYYDVSIE